MAEIPPHHHSVLLNSRLSPSRATYTGIALPHCALAVAQTWNSPFPAASAGSHSREMRIAEIPVPSYLIIPGCHAGRHNPLLFTFTGNNVIHCRSVFARNGVLPPLPMIDKGENKIRCMRVLFNCQVFRLFLPEIIIAEMDCFSEC